MVVAAKGVSAALGRDDCGERRGGQEGLGHWRGCAAFVLGRPELSPMGPIPGPAHPNRSCHTSLARHMSCSAMLRTCRANQALTWSGKAWPEL